MVSCSGGKTGKKIGGVKDSVNSGFALLTDSEVFDELEAIARRNPKAVEQALKESDQKGAKNVCA
jgi:hypothetical protein